VAEVLPRFGKDRQAARAAGVGTFVWAKDLFGW
jgi:hypothetical protein